MLIKKKLHAVWLSERNTGMVALKGK